MSASGGAVNRESGDKMLKSLTIVLSLLSLGVFVLGSAAYKMVGVETIYAIQTVRILQAASRYYQA
jgi:hypothetical protein